MNRDRILLVALLVVCVLQSLVTLSLLASQRRAEGDLVELRQQLTELGTKTDRLHTTVAGLPQELARVAPASTSSSNGGDAGERGVARRKEHGGGDEARAASRVEAVVTVMAQLMVLEYRGDVQLSEGQREKVKQVFLDYKAGQHDGLRKRLLGLLEANQIEFLNAQARLVDEKGLQLRNIPNASESTYVDLAIDFLQRPLHPDSASSGQPSSTGSGQPSAAGSGQPSAAR